MRFTKVKFKVYEAGWSVTSLARYLGCSAGQVSRVLGGDQAYPGMQRRIARVLNMPVADAFGKLTITNPPRGAYCSYLRERRDACEERSELHQLDRDEAELLRAAINTESQADIRHALRQVGGA